MPLRTLLILIAVAIIVMAARRLFFNKPSATQAGRKSGKMVQCASCGIYIPETEALTDAGRSYCSRAHLEEDKRQS